MARGRHGRSEDHVGDEGAESGSGRGQLVVHLDELLAARDMTLTELAERVGITVTNMSILKNARAKAVRFSTLAAICRELGCQPGDVLGYRPAGDDGVGA